MEDDSNGVAVFSIDVCVTGITLTHVLDTHQAMARGRLPYCN